MDWTDPDDSAGAADATTVGAGFNTSTLDIGDGLNWDSDNKAADGYFTAKWQNSPNDTDGSSNDDPYSDDLATAITREIYWTFSISKTDSSAFDIASVDIGELNNRDTRTDYTYYLLSDVGGFSASESLASAGATNSINWSATGTDFNGLTSVEFRVYVTGNGGDLDYKENSIGIEGDGLSDITVTAVPEPSIYAAIMGLIALGGILIRHRNRKG